MSAKRKKKVPLPKYGLGGDILNTGLNLWGDFTGMGGITDSIVNNIDPNHKDPVIENEFLKKVNNFSDRVLSPISQTIAPIALNMVAPGAGSLLGGVQAGANALNPELNGTTAAQQAASTAPKQLLNVDSRYIHRANGGPIINEMPMGNYGTDQIPTDQSGMPSKQTGRKPIAFTDAGELTWNGYVFSQDLGFADKAKKIANRYKFRLGDKFDKGDRYSEEALDRELTKLAQQQEQVRPKDVVLPEFHYGGGLPHSHTDPNDIYTVGSNQDVLNTPLKPQRTLAPSSIPAPINPDITSPANSNFFGDNSALLLGGVAQALPLIARGINLANNKPEVVNTPKYTPTDIDLSAQREDLQRRAVGAKQTAIRNSRYNPAAQLAGVTAYDEQLASGLGESWMNQETMNARERNRAGMFNTQITQQDNELTAREKGAYNMALETLYGDMSQLALGMSTDYQKKSIQDKLLKSMQSKNFNIDPETLAIMIKQIEPYLSK